MPQQSNATSKKTTVKAVTKSSALSKPAAGSKVTAAKRVKKSGNGADRQGMIETAAYYRAEQRGFNGSCELDDWLAAEAEIDAMIYH